MSLNSRIGSNSVVWILHLLTEIVFFPFYSDASYFNKVVVYFCLIALARASRAASSGSGRGDRHPCRRLRGKASGPRPARVRGTSRGRPVGGRCRAEGAPFLVRVRLAFLSQKGVGSSPVISAPVEVTEYSHPVGGRQPRGPR